MNEQEIDNLVGRELDIAVEKYIFGREQPQDASYEQLDDGTWQANIPDTYVDDDGYEYYARSWSVVEWPPYYHKSDCLVWQVVDILMDSGKFSNILVQKYARDKWWVGLRTGTYLDGFAWGKSRSIAFCRAALKVVCNDQKDD